MQYFEHEAQNTTIRPSERAKLQDFYDELIDPTFQLYLYFLQGHLPLLASMNMQLQKRNQDLFTVYQTPVLKVPSLSLKWALVCKKVIYKQILMTDCQSTQSNLYHFLQSSLHDVMKNVFSFTCTIGRSLETRFPEMEFVVRNLGFLCPENRKHCRCDIEAVVMRYCQGMVNATIAKMQYSVYRNDDSLDFLYLNCDKKPDAFLK